MHTTSSSPKRFASLLVAFTVLLNAATAYLSADSYEASDLAEARGDDSGGSETERQGAPTVADERKLTDGSTCPATCFGDSCDYWMATCETLEGYSCDCSGCDCGDGSGTAAPSVEPAPTPGPTVTLPPTTVCFDLFSGHATDLWGDSCTGGPYGGYDATPSWCGHYDDIDFSSNQMCCVCGGGSRTAVPSASPAPTVECTNVCADTDNGAVDIDADHCTGGPNGGYEEVPELCGLYDDLDFSALEMCCACGGGYTCSPCWDADGGATNAHASGSRSCGWALYSNQPATCADFDDDDFTANEMCCACGGGTGTAPSPAPTSSLAPTALCTADCFGYSCDYWSNGCVEMETTYGCDCEGCACDAALCTTAGCFGYSCDYWANTCEELEMAHGCDCEGCACAGETHAPTTFTPAPTPTPVPTRLCIDTNAAATDPYGDGCFEYVPSWCGGYDDSDFSSNQMCCACGGGADTHTPTATPAPTSFTPMPSQNGSCPGGCFGYSCDDWTTTSTCNELETAYGCDCGGCSCANTTFAPTTSPVPTPLTPVPTQRCIDTNPPAATDPYGDGCVSYLPSWCGNYDDSDFSSNQMCCACGGGSPLSPTQGPTASPPPTASLPPTTFTPMPTETCRSTCYGQSCDFWSASGYLCVQLETAYACDCDECECVGDPTPAPTTTSPTVTETPTTSVAPSTAPTISLQPSVAPTSHYWNVDSFSALEHTIRFATAAINVTKHIVFTSALEIAGSIVHIISSIDAVLSGGDVTRLFTVTLGGVLQLEGISLTNGRTCCNGGGIDVVEGALLMVRCVISSNMASDGNGGGVHLGGVSSGTFASCRFDNNEAVRYLSFPLLRLMRSCRRSYIVCSFLGIRRCRVLDELFKRRVLRQFVYVKLSAGGRRCRERSERPVPIECSI